MTDLFLIGHSTTKMHTRKRNEKKKELHIPGNITFLLFPARILSLGNVIGS